MSQEVQSILNEDFIRSLNEEQALIPEAELPPAPEEDTADYPLTDPLEESDPVEPLLDEFEDWEEGEGMDEAEIEDFGELAVDAIHATKDFLNLYFGRKLGEKLKAKFPEEDYKYLALIRFSDQEENLSMESLHLALTNAKTYTEEYNQIEFSRLLHLAIEYRELKKAYQASEFKEYQQNGIRRYTVMTIRKYFRDARPDPLAMLTIYVLITLGMDGLRLWKAFRE